VANTLNVFRGGAVGFIDWLGATLIINVLPMLQIFQATTARANIRLREMNIATDWANLVSFAAHWKGNRVPAGAKQPVSSDEDPRKVK